MCASVLPRPALLGHLKPGSPSIAYRTKHTKQTNFTLRQLFPSYLGAFKGPRSPSRLTIKTESSSDNHDHALGPFITPRFYS